MQNMINLNLNDCEASVLICRAMKYEKNVLTSTVSCCLIYHINGYQLKNSNQPMCKNIVFFLAAWE